MTHGTKSLGGRTDGQLVLAVQGQDQAAFSELFERWFDRVFDVARNIVRKDETAAEVAQETFLTVWQQMDSLSDPDAFGGWILRISRNRSLNRLKKEQRSRPMEAQVMTGLHDRDSRDDHVGSNRITSTDQIVEARDRQDLMWAVSGVLGARDASLMDLTLRHQLSPAEIAAELGLSDNNAHQLLYRLRNKLSDAVANYLVWRDGAPRCGDLRSLLVTGADSAPAVFDAPTNRKVQHHTKACSTCSAQKTSGVDPTKLFASIPVAIAPVFFRSNAASALSQLGVPVGKATGGVVPKGQLPSSPSRPSTGRSILRSKRVRLPILATVSAAIIVGLVLFSGSPVTEIDLATRPPATEPASPSTTSDPAQATTTPTSIATPTTVIFESPTSQAEASASPTTASPASTTSKATPSTTAPASSAATSTSQPPPSTTEPPAPVIVQFTITNLTNLDLGSCGGPNEALFSFNWVVAETTSVALSTSGGTTTYAGSDGYTACSLLGSSATLTATGPGGSTSRTESL